jgi:RNA polymerase sigma-70 factor (ECF subfamily)
MEADETLINRYRDGDVHALERLVERHRRTLFGYIINMTEGREDADEVFQEVWFRAIRKLRLYRSKNFPGWLLRIAHNLVIDRARRRRPQVSLDGGPDGDRPALGDSLADPAPSSADRAAHAEIASRIREAVAGLPAEQREVFVMRTVQGLGFKEIAAVQKVSINTALARMHYATGKMRVTLRDLYDEL